MNLYKFAKNPIVWWPVTINEPLDGGVVRQYKLKGKFEIISTPDQDAIYAAGGSDIDLMRRTLKSWEDMPGADDKPVAFSPEAMEEVMAMPFVRSGFVESYVAASVGRAAARKN